MDYPNRIIETVATPDSVAITLHSGERITISPNEQGLLHISVADRKTGGTITVKKTAANCCLITLIKGKQEKDIFPKFTGPNLA
jgi:hypothetical protein